MKPHYGNKRRNNTALGYLCSNDKHGFVRSLVQIHTVGPIYENHEDSSPILRDAFKVGTTMHWSTLTIPGNVRVMTTLTWRPQPRFGRAVFA